MMKQYCPNYGGDYKNIYDKINMLPPQIKIQTKEENSLESP